MSTGSSRRRYTQFREPFAVCAYWRCLPVVNGTGCRLRRTALESGQRSSTQPAKTGLPLEFGQDDFRPVGGTGAQKSNHRFRDRRAGNQQVVAVAAADDAQVLRPGKSCQDFIGL